MASPFLVPTRTAPYDIALAEFTPVWRDVEKAIPRGLELGRLIHHWKPILRSKGGHGSKGKGLSEILTVLGMPRHIADYWENEYKISIGLTQRVTCPQCGDQFPSMGAYKKHRQQ
jgi:hypothetical protein